MKKWNVQYKDTLPTYPLYSRTSAKIISILTLLLVPLSPADSPSPLLDLFWRSQRKSSFDGFTLYSSSFYTMVDQGPTADAQCPTWAASLGYMGVAAAVCLSNWGSAVSRRQVVKWMQLVNAGKLVWGISILELGESPELIRYYRWS